MTAIQGARVIDLVHGEDRVTGVRFETQDLAGPAREVTASARLVAGCDGRRSFVARAARAREYITEPPINFAFYTYFEGADPGPEPEPMFEIWESKFNGGTPMLALCDDGIWMAIVYLPQEQFDSFRSQKDTNFWKAMDSDPRVGPRLHRGSTGDAYQRCGRFLEFRPRPGGRRLGIGRRCRATQGPDLWSGDR